MEQFINTVPDGAPVLPTGYGVNVNIPPLTADAKEPPIVQTRFTGNAHVNEAIFDSDQGTFTWANIKPYADGVNACINGDCSLPGETYVTESGSISLSLYTVDYTAPASTYTKLISERVSPLLNKHPRSYP